MNKKRAEINFQDERGYIQDILTNESIEHVTYIFTKKGVVRGNHYHKETVQYAYILDGKVEYHYADVSGKKGMVILEASEYIKTPPHERHAIKTLEDTKMLVFTLGVRGGMDYEKDTYRLQEPIVS